MSYAKQMKTEQTLDQYGNVTQSKIYNFGPSGFLVGEGIMGRCKTENYMPRFSAFGSRGAWSASS
jgi:hypothetical protein